MSTTIIDGSEVPARLRELGIPLEDIRGAVATGEISRRSCTEHDAAQAPGFYAWNDTLRALRDRCVTRGWHAGKRGLETLVRDDERIEIAVATGDEGTGESVIVPHTKYPKGPETIKAVMRNNAHPRFDFAKPDLTAADSGISPETWILLIRSTEHGVKCEVSRPRSLDDSDRVAAWDERIILPTVQPDGPPESGSDRDDDEGPAIEVTRRAG